MVPPSIHPCGERLEWEEYSEPAKVDGNKLLDCVARATACISSRSTDQRKEIAILPL